MPFFAVHGILYLNFKRVAETVLVFHHILNFLAVIPITNVGAYYFQDTVCSDVTYFVSAGLHLVEISTVTLDIRIFFKLWNKRVGFYLSTIGLWATYFPLRCIWLGYVAYYMLRERQVIDTCFGHNALYILMSAFAFVWIMSAGYTIVMLQSGSRLFRLKKPKDL